MKECLLSMCVCIFSLCVCVCQSKLVICLMGENSGFQFSQEKEKNAHDYNYQPFSGSSNPSNLMKEIQMKYKNEKEEFKFHDL